MTNWVLDLARNRPKLFHLLYLSDGFNGRNLIEVMMGYESNKRMISKMMELYCLDENACKNILLRGCLFLMGISTMICVNHMDFSNEQVAMMMKQTISDMVNGEREKL